MGGKPSREEQINSMTKDCMKKAGIFANERACKFLSKKGLKKLEKREENNPFSKKNQRKKRQKSNIFKW